MTDKKAFPLLIHALIAFGSGLALVHNGWETLLTPEGIGGLMVNIANALIAARNPYYRNVRDGDRRGNGGER